MPLLKKLFSRPRTRHRLRAVLASMTAVAFVAFNRYVVMTNYTRTHLPTASSYSDAISTMVEMPGAFVTYILSSSSVRHHHHWVIVLGTPVVNLLFYYAVFRLAGSSFRRAFPIWWRLHKPENEVPLPARRRFLATTTASVMTAGTGVLSYSLLIEPRRFHVRRHEVEIADLPESLDGLVIAQLTDIHHCSWTPLSYVREIVQTTNALNADLILLTGDYVRASPEFIRPVCAELASLRSRMGSVATLGNHDWDQDAALTKRCLGLAGIPMLDNTRMIVTPERKLVRKSEHGLAIAGVGDLWGDRQDYQAALGNLPPKMPRILVSHNPDVAEEKDFLAARHRVDLMVTGHLHGGQVWIPFLGAPMTPSRFGTKYARGFTRGPTTLVYCSAGLGESGMPLRLGAPPELSVLILRRPRA